MTMHGDARESKKVSVAVRIRPRLESRGEKYELDTVKKVDQNVCVCVNPSRLKEQTSYCFDYVLDEDDNQEDVYKLAAADIANSSLEGTDNVILTYGQTGSGKTYTLLGNKLKCDGSLDQDSGIFLRVLFDLLEYRERCSSSHHLVIALSIIEIYNDQLRDLLNGKQVLGIKEQGDDAAIMNATIKTITTKEDVNQAFDVAISNRSVAPTLMNDTSSRSHAMFIVDLFQQRKTPSNMTPPDPAEYLTAMLNKDTSNTVPFSRMSTGGRKSTTGTSRRRPTTLITTYDESSEFPITRSTLTMVDLAGSERAKKSGAQGAVLQEAVYVNKSLTSLGKVVNSLHTNSKHIPFRESKLTRLLRSSLVSGQSRILLITNIAPTDSSYNETASSLHFADRLQELKAPQGGQYKVGDSEKEAEFLKYLRLAEELGSEIRTAQVYFPNFSHYLRHRTRESGMVRQERNYRVLNQTMIEDEKVRHGEELRSMVAKLVAGMEAERPEMAENKKRVETLNTEIDKQVAAHNATRAHLAEMQEELALQEQNAKEPHETYMRVTAQAERLSEDLRKATQKENQLTAQIAKLTKELDEFKSPLEENRRMSQSLEEQQIHVAERKKVVGERLEWGERVMKLLKARVGVEEMAGEVAKLEAGVKEPGKLETAWGGGKEVPVDKGVSPLAWEFDGVRDPTPFVKGSGLKVQLCEILERIAKEKMCFDEDGRQLFGILAQVRVTQPHLSCIASLYANTNNRWRDPSMILRDCHTIESASFAVRSYILFPTATSILDKGQEGSLEVLEFVELLLKEWQSTGTHSEELRGIVSAHP